MDNISNNEWIYLYLLSHMSHISFWHKIEWLYYLALAHAVLVEYYCLLGARMRGIWVTRDMCHEKTG